MGFWSSVGSFVSSVGSSISSGFSSLCSSISSGFSSFISGAGSIIMGLSSIGLGSIGGVVAAISTICCALGLMRPQEKMEDLGDQMLQAADAGIRPINFEKYDQYLAEIRSFNIDPEKSQKYSADEKNLAGLAVMCKAVEEKFDLSEGSMGHLAALNALNPTFFTSERLQNWITSSYDIDKIIAYFDNRLDINEMIDIEDGLVKMEQDVVNDDHPQSRDNIINSLDQAKVDVQECYQKLIDSPSHT